jgi:hypothetical protein
MKKQLVDKLFNAVLDAENLRKKKANDLTALTPDERRAEIRALALRWVCDLEDDAFVDFANEIYYIRQKEGKKKYEFRDI